MSPFEGGAGRRGMSAFIIMLIIKELHPQSYLDYSVLSMVLGLRLAFYSVHKKWALSNLKTQLVDF